MQNLLSEEQNDSRSTKASLWSQLGPVLLLGSFAGLVLKCAPLYWPIALTAFLGYATTLYLKKRGFYLSLFILAAVFVLLLRTSSDVFWPLLLSGSIALSWALIFLGDQENLSSLSNLQQKITSLEENCRLLEKHLSEAKVAVSKESKDLALEKEHLKAELIDVTNKYNQTLSSLQIAQREREKLNEKCSVLSQDAFAYQRKEIAFQHALEDSQMQLIKMKGQLAAFLEPKAATSNIVPMEEIDPQEKEQLLQIRHQYANLREQFEEKSQALDLARKELFKMENELLAMQKLQEEKANEISDEDLRLMQDLKDTEEECRDLEAQVNFLQDLITSLLSSKKRASRAKKSSDDESLPFLLQEKIDQTTSSKKSNKR